MIFQGKTRYIVRPPESNTLFLCRASETDRKIYCVQSRRGVHRQVIGWIDKPYQQIIQLAVECVVEWIRETLMKSS